MALEEYRNHGELVFAVEEEELGSMAEKYVAYYHSAKGEARVWEGSLSIRGSGKFARRSVNRSKRSPKNKKDIEQNESTINILQKLINALS